MFFPLLVIAVICIILVFDLKKSMHKMEIDLYNLEKIVESLKKELSKLKEKGTTLSEFANKKSSSVSPLPVEAETVKVPPKPVETPTPVILEPKIEEKESVSAVSDFDWENFLSVKLFAWLGGFALFLGAIFLAKYSIDHNLISYEMRIVSGLLLGIGAIIGGVYMHKRDYAFTSQSLCGAGIAILYGDIFAAHALYNFISIYPTFGFMVLVTITACLLAVQLNFRFVAILGLLGGFLTPVLLSTGVDNPIGLFGYIFILNCGLGVVSYYRKWNFLIGSSTVATIIMQILWVSKYFTPEKIYVCMGIFLLFVFFFLAVSFIFDREEKSDDIINFTSALIAIYSLVFTFYLFTFPSLSIRPGLLFSYIFIIDIAVTSLSFYKDKYYQTHIATGIISFFLLSSWTISHFNQSLLYWALGFYFIFAVLYALVPVILQRFRPGAKLVELSYGLPLLMIILIFIPLIKLEIVPFIIWPVILLIDMVIIFMAYTLKKFWPCIIVVILSWIATLLYAFSITIIYLSSLLFVVFIFAAIFFALGLFFIQNKTEFFDLKEFESFSPLHLSTIAAFLPFILMAIVSTRFPMSIPHNVFGLTLVLGSLILYIAFKSENDLIIIAALGGTLLVEYSWHSFNFHEEYFTFSILWYSLFYLLYLLSPFFVHRHYKDKTIPWVLSAGSGVMHFYLFYNSITKTFGNSFIGILPAALAVITLPCLSSLIKKEHGEDDIWKTQLAYFGGVLLLFVTMVIPLQLDNEWITISWALEGLALFWLLKRIPHQGIKYWAIALFIICFVRLALNPAILSYHPKSGIPIFNWYLYTYGIVAACMFASSIIIPEKFSFIEQFALRPYLKIGGTIITFLLLNIEIADYYSVGQALTFKFSGNIAMDMTYSLSWLVFSSILIVIGILNKIYGARIGGLGLLILTIFKVFLHDLWRLGQLYRVASFIGLAVTLILISFLYQKFLKTDKLPEKKEDRND